MVPMRIPAALGALAILVGLAPAQSGDAAGGRGVLGPLGPGPDVHLDRLCVKLADATAVECEGGALRSRTGCDLGAVIAAVAGTRVEPLVQGLPRAQLDEWHEHACAVLPPGRQPGHMGCWLRVVAPSRERAAEVRAQLLRAPWVEHAYLEPRVGESALPGGDPPPPTPPFMALQGYWDPSPTGTGLRQAQGILGARGQGVRLRMVERDWVLGHEDIDKLVAANFIGAVTPGNLGSANHGLAGTSILVADRNAWGLTGGVDEVDIRFLGVIENGGTPNAVLVAMANSQPGDVILMVLQFLLGQVGIDDFVPVEYLQAEFDAVLTATSNGRIVVCSAANGFRSLDDPRHLRRFDRTFRDSGAIMAAATDGSTLVRAPYCNFGSRIDANGWGENVVTAGYGTLFYGNNDPLQSYTAGYSGTSAATPIVCATVVALQGAAKRQLGRALTGAEILALLHQHGPASPDTIGRRPDVAAMFRALGIVDGLEPAAPDALPGGAVPVTLSGSGGGAVLFASFGTGNTSLGFNRPVHLDLGSLQTVGFFVLAGGQATWNLQVPNIASLSGASLFLQAGVLLPGGGVHVTNSAQVSVL
jgi:hypothetical protein